MSQTSKYKREWRRTSFGHLNVAFLKVVKRCQQDTDCGQSLICVDEWCVLPGKHYCCIYESVYTCMSLLKSHDYLIMLLTFVFYKTVKCRSNEDCGSDACDTVSGRCEYFPRLVKLYITISYFDDLDKNNFISTLLLLLLQYDGMSLFKIFLLC